MKLDITLYTAVLVLVGLILLATANRAQCAWCSQPNGCGSTSECTEGCVCAFDGSPLGQCVQGEW